MDREPLRRVGVLGDVHCEDVAVAQALGLFEQEGVDAVLCVGDTTDGPGDLERTCELLRTHGVVSVAGNHERWFLRGELRDLPDATLTVTNATREYLATLPATRVLPSIAGPILLCHGLGRDDMATVRDHDEGYALTSNEALQELIAAGRYALVISGHSHRRLVRRFGPTVFVNAGTLFREHDPVVLLLDLVRGEAQFTRPDGSPVQTIVIP